MTHETRNLPSETGSKYYALDARLPAGIFGTTYAATSVKTNPGASRSWIEFAIFLTRPKPELLYEASTMPFGTLLGGLEVIGVEQLHAEALMQAKMALAFRLEARAQELGRPDLELVGLEFRELGYRPLTGAWMNRLWQPEIKALASKGVEGGDLRRYCELLSQTGSFDSDA